MTWRDDLNYGLGAFGIHLPKTVSLDDLAMKLSANPARNTAAVVAVSAAVFYAAERDHNPKVNDLYDAMIYCSTCLSVGYGDIFAHTPVGKLIGTSLMTLGPALSGRAMDGKATPDAIAVQQQMLDTMQAILSQMQSKTADDETQD